MAYITVVENEGEEMVELPLEEDGTLSLGTLQCQYPGACGLKYRSPDSGAWRGLRVTNGVVSQVNNDWSGNHCYVVVYPKVPVLIDVLDCRLLRFEFFLSMTQTSSRLSVSHFLSYFGSMVIPSMEGNSLIFSHSRLRTTSERGKKARAVKR